MKRPGPNTFDTECDARLDEPFAARYARCILDVGHASPNHWGPDRNGNYVQWPKTTVMTG